jgi:hypothetical protein
MTDIIFKLQISMSLIVGGFVVAWYVLPALNKKTFYAALLPPLLIAALRFHGLNFMVPEINDGLPEAFSHAAGPGDFIVAIIAIIALIALRMKWSVGVWIAWAYAILGTLDLAYGFYLGELYGMSSYLGATWFMVIYEAPLEILALFVLFKVLLSHPGKNKTAALEKSSV